MWLMCQMSSTLPGRLLLPKRGFRSIVPARQKGNLETASRLLKEYSEYFKILNPGAGKWKSLLYDRASAVIFHASKRHDVLGLDELVKLDGIGRKLAGVVQEIIETLKGTFDDLETCRRDKTLTAMKDLMQVSGLGPVTARLLVDGGVDSVSELRKSLALYDEYAAKVAALTPDQPKKKSKRAKKKVDESQINDDSVDNNLTPTIPLPLNHEAYSVLSKFNHHQRIGLKYVEEFSQRIPRWEVERLENSAHALSPLYLLTVCGSYRRGHPDCGDMDVLITHPESGSNKRELTFPGPRSKKTKDSGPHFLTNLVKKLEDSGLLTDDLGLGDSKYMGVCQLPGVDNEGKAYPHRRIDIRYIPYEFYWYGVLHFTENDAFNIYMRLRANTKGFKLSEYGLQDEHGECEAKVTPVSSEEEIFKLLELPWREPTQREILNTGMGATGQQAQIGHEFLQEVFSHTCNAVVDYVRYKIILVMYSPIIDVALSKDAVAKSFPLMAKEFPNGLEAARTQLLEYFQLSLSEEFDTICRKWGMPTRLADLQEMIVRAKNLEEPRSFKSFPSPEVVRRNITARSSQILLQRLRDEAAKLDEENKAMAEEVIGLGKECDQHLQELESHHQSLLNVRIFPAERMRAMHIRFVRKPSSHLLSPLWEEERTNVRYRRVPVNRPIIQRPRLFPMSSSPQDRCLDEEQVTVWMQQIDMSHRLLLWGCQLNRLDVGKVQESLLPSATISVAFEAAQQLRSRDQEPLRHC
ncbi:hypothetical protein BJ742DRAFT_737754 [Cladochytrium replicatum]|nr:hypothetical protein BJ742DRAFT_737754 [Cladochytrium replicatum]